MGTHDTSGTERGPFAVAHPDGPVVLFGTSYAKSWNLQQIGHIPVVNRGRAGDRTVELLARFEKDVIGIQPRAVIIWGFDNDLLDPPPGGFREAMAHVRDSVLQMVDRARTAGIEPILATEVTMGERAGVYEALADRAEWLLGRMTEQDRINRQVLDGDEWLRQLAREQSIFLLDLQPILSDQFHYRRPEFAATDGAHISKSGYDALAAYAVPALVAHFD
jgi:lysophospholipase L1-like esterase